MFTGLVEALGEVRSLRDEPGPSKRLALAADIFTHDVDVGDSIAINGCCLTVTSVRNRVADFQAGDETLKRTNLGKLRTGDAVNLERSLPADGRLGGHFVTGHIDGVGAIQSRRREHDWDLIWIQTPLARQLVSKGSVAVDGVSLTVVDVADDAFSVALIPHTLAVTTLGRRKTGDTVNIETDILGKYVLKFLGRQGVTEDLIKEAFNLL